MQISREDVDHVALLARLGLTDEERERFRTQLEQILAYVAQLNELDTSLVSPSAQVIGAANVTRPDTVRAGLTAQQALANAPERSDAYFAVPPVLDAE